MPRKAREKSRTGIYHVIFRGINKQRIFEEEQDYRKFLYQLKDQQLKSGFRLYAYCLMGNHVHLLLREGEEDLGALFRRIAAQYVQWYNGKYEREGHLFQDRYKSEVVETPQYFLGLIRYIHQNPLKAGMVKALEDYPWSSYREYFGQGDLKLCQQDLALDLTAGTRRGLWDEKHLKPKEDAEKEPPREKPILAGDEKNNREGIIAGVVKDQRDKGKMRLKEFHSLTDHNPYLEYDRGRRWRDEDAADFVKERIRGKSPTVIQNYDPEKRREIITICKSHGISLRQLERITGIGYSILRRI